MFIIYKTTCLVNGKIYIGQHEVHSLKKLDTWYLGSGKLLLNAISKYGKENFKRKVICKVYTQEKANELEEFFIKKYNSTDLSIGYNILSGSPYENHPLKVPEIRERVAEANRGKVWSPEVREKISKSVSNTMTKERRKLISSQHKGKVISKETKEKMSKSLKGRSWINNGIKCKFVDISNGLPQGYYLGRKL